MQLFDTPEKLSVNSQSEFLLSYDNQVPSNEIKNDLPEINNDEFKKAANCLDFAGETGLRKREEKELLLSFSRDIATAEDKKGLGLVIKQYLKNLFRIKRIYYHRQK